MRMLTKSRGWAGSPGKVKAGWWLLCGVLFSGGQVQAELPAGGISMDRTRYVFMAGQRDMPVTVKNDTDEPFLAQLWVRKMDEKSGGAVEGGRQPFLLAPPLHRMAPHTSQTFRLIGVERMTDALPKDRESVFYISAKMIPATSRPEDDDMASGGKGDKPKPGLGGESNLAMQILMVTNARMFYRPAGLKEDGVADAAKSLTFSVSGREGHDRVLRVKNQSAYYMAFGALRVGARGEPGTEINCFPMVPPHGEYAYPLPESVMLPADVVVTWQVIDEQGLPTAEQQTPLRIG